MARRNRRLAFARYQRNARLFSRDVIGLEMYGYQADIADMVLRVIEEGQTADITVEMSRQAGKNELSAQLECLLLARYARVGGTMVKAAPTWSPQIVRSKHRLESRIAAVKRKLPFLEFQGREGYIMQCGEASIHFLSGKPTANVVGDTADLLLEVDEAQDFDQVKFDKDFAPMRATTGAPAIFYGTTWTDATLLERTKTAIQEKRVQGHIFRIPWDRVAADNPRYGDFVLREIERLGEEHPIIRTQYRLQPIEEQGRLLRNAQLQQMIGDHPRAQRRTAEPQIVAGLDFAGADEEAGEMVSLANNLGRDSVALTVARVDWVTIAAGITEPVVRVLDRREWTNVHPTSLHTTLYHILHDDWQADLIYCDATGIGEVSTAYLAKALNRPGRERVVGIKFDSAWNTHTRLAFQMIAAVNGSRFLDYAVDFDPISVAAQDWPPKDNVTRHAWWQRGHARLEAKSNRRVKTYVPDNEGHDDILMSELLMLDAAYIVGQPQVMRSGQVDWYGQQSGPAPAPAPARSAAEIDRILRDYDQSH